MYVFNNTVYMNYFQMSNFYLKIKGMIYVYYLFFDKREKIN